MTRPKSPYKGPYADRPKFPPKGPYADRPKFPHKGPYADRPEFPNKGLYADRPKFPNKGLYDDRPKFPHKGLYADRLRSPHRSMDGDRVKASYEGSYADRPKSPYKGLYSDRPKSPHKGLYSDRPKSPHKGLYSDRPKSLHKGLYSDRTKSPYKFRNRSPPSPKRDRKSSSYPDFGDYESGQRLQRHHESFSSHSSFDDSPVRVKQKKKKKRNRSLEYMSDGSMSPPQKKPKHLQQSKSNFPPSSGTTQALETLREVHENECARYRKNPTIHPSYKKEKNLYIDRMSQQAFNAGRNPFQCDLTKGFDKFWKVRQEELFEEAWGDKRNRCLDMLEINNKKTRSKMKRNIQDSAYEESTQPYHGDRRPSRMRSSVAEANPGRSAGPSPIEHSFIPEPPRDILLTSPRKKLSSPPKQLRSQLVNSLDIIETLTVLSQMADQFGELAMPLSAMFRAAVDNQKTGKDPLLIFDRPEFEVLRLAMKMLSEMKVQNITFIQRAIVEEGSKRIEKLLAFLHEKLDPHYGLNLRQICRQVEAFDTAEGIAYIKRIILGRGYFYVKDSEVFKIFVAAKKMN